MTDDCFGARFEIWELKVPSRTAMLREERRPEISLRSKLQPAEARQLLCRNFRSHVEFLAALQW
jgi:hypothetical protein